MKITLFNVPTHPAHFLRLRGEDFDLVRVGPDSCTAEGVPVKSRLWARMVRKSPMTHLGPRMLRLVYGLRESDEPHSETELSAMGIRFSA